MNRSKSFRRLVLKELKNFLMVSDKDPSNDTVMLFPPLEQRYHVILLNICKSMGLRVVKVKIPQTNKKYVIVGKFELRNPELKQNKSTQCDLSSSDSDSGFVRDEQRQRLKEVGIKMEKASDETRETPMKNPVAIDSQSGIRGILKHQLPKKVGIKMGKISDETGETSKQNPITIGSQPGLRGILKHQKPKEVGIKMGKTSYKTGETSKQNPIAIVYQPGARGKLKHQLPKKVGIKMGKSSYERRETSKQNPVGIDSQPGVRGKLKYQLPKEVGIKMGKTSGETGKTSKQNPVAIDSQPGVRGKLKQQLPKKIGIKMGKTSDETGETPKQNSVAIDSQPGTSGIIRQTRKPRPILGKQFLYSKVDDQPGPSGNHSRSHASSSISRMESSGIGHESSVSIDTPAHELDFTGGQEGPSGMNKQRNSSEYSPTVSCEDQPPKEYTKVKIVPSNEKENVVELTGMRTYILIEKLKEYREHFIKPSGKKAPLPSQLAENLESTRVGSLGSSEMRKWDNLILYSSATEFAPCKLYFEKSQGALFAESQETVFEKSQEAGHEESQEAVLVEPQETGSSEMRKGENLMLNSSATEFEPGKLYLEKSQGALFTESQETVFEKSQEAGQEESQDAVLVEPQETGSSEMRKGENLILNSGATEFEPSKLYLEKSQGALFAESQETVFEKSQEAVHEESQEAGNEESQEGLLVELQETGSSEMRKGENLMLNSGAREFEPGKLYLGKSQGALFAESQETVCEESQEAVHEESQEAGNEESQEGLLVELQETGSSEMRKGENLMLNSGAREFEPGKLYLGKSQGALFAESQETVCEESQEAVLEKSEEIEYLGSSEMRKGENLNLNSSATEFVPSKVDLELEKSQEAVHEESQETAYEASHGLEGAQSPVYKFNYYF